MRPHSLGPRLTRAMAVGPPHPTHPTPPHTPCHTPLPCPHQNRNINYTNVCTYACSFCAFRWGQGRAGGGRATLAPRGCSRSAAKAHSPAGHPSTTPSAALPDAPAPLPSHLARSKGKAAEEVRGAPYLLPLEEVARRTAEAWDRGATEVCMQVRPWGSAAHSPGGERHTALAALRCVHRPTTRARAPCLPTPTPAPHPQGGIHPDFNGDSYLRLLGAAKAAAPDMHVHAFRCGAWLL